MNRLRSAPFPMQLRDALNSGLDALPDAELLDRFARYADHPAFEVIVRRHGPMVFGVCRRMLVNSADADDAFQAAFLVLIRKARSLRRGDRLGPWLYGVACRVALKARSQAARRAAFCTEATDIIPDPAEPVEIPDWLPVLDAELAALPAKYRDPLVLCELQGATRADAAKSLGVPEGTLSSRLARGRDLLRKRLLKHGTLLPAGGLPALFATNGVGRATVPLSLLSRTSELAKVATGAAPAGAVPVGAARLTDEVLKGMFLTKLRLASVPLVLVALAIGLSTAALPSDAPDAQPDKGAKAVSVTKAPERKMPTPVAPGLSVVEFADKGTVLPDREALQGLWVVEKGEGSSSAYIGKSKFLIDGDVWWWMPGADQVAVSAHRARLAPDKNPKWLDFAEVGTTVPVDFGGKVQCERCIYELDGDHLRLCLGSSGARPAEFSTEEPELSVVHLRREKLPPPAGEKGLTGVWTGRPNHVVPFKRGNESSSITPAAVVTDSHMFLLVPAPHRKEAVWIGGRYTVDTSKNPKWFDLELAGSYPNEKVTKLFGSYAIGEDGIELSLGLTGKRAVRPLSLWTNNPEDNWLYFTFVPAKNTPEPKDVRPNP